MRPRFIDNGEGTCQNCGYEEGEHLLEERCPDDNVADFDRHYEAQYACGYYD